MPNAFTFRLEIRNVHQRELKLKINEFYISLYYALDPPLNMNLKFNH